MNKPPVIKPGDDLWQWAARSETPSASVPVASPAARGILVRLWASLRGILPESSRSRKSTRSRRS